MNSTVIVIDARSRERNVFTASATQLPGMSAIVLRKGAAVGKVETLHGQTAEYPILVVGSYAARSSAGHVTPIGVENFDSVVWVGGAGFGFTEHGEDGKAVHKGYGLRPFGWPLEATLIPAGARVSAVETHRNSNPATADAAFAGLRLQAKANPRLLVLVEGQSDYTSATAIEVPENAEAPEFQEEHRAEDLFSPEKMFNAAVRRLVKGDEGRKALTLAIVRAAYRTGKDASFIGGLPAAVREILGDEEIKRIVEEQVAAYEAEGWKFGYDMSLANHFTRAVSTNGTVTDGSALFPSPEVEESFLELSTLNTEEEKRNLRTSNLSNRMGSHFWYAWATSSHKFGFNDSRADYLVVAAIEGMDEPVRLWFSRDSKSPSADGLPSNGYRFLSAFDVEGKYLWDNLLEVTTLTITAYEDGEAKAERVWRKAEDRGCGTPVYPWMAS